MTGFIKAFAVTFFVVLGIAFLAVSCVPQELPVSEGRQ